MLDAGARVIDLSGAFRLRTPPTTWPGTRKPHPTCPTGRGRLRPAGILPRPHPGRAAGGQSGLLPDGGQSGDSPAARSRCGGPLLRHRLRRKSGVSGAGRKPTLKTSFCEVTENFSAYSILRHVTFRRCYWSAVWRKASSASPRNCCRSTRHPRNIYFRAYSAGSADDLLAIYEKRYAASRSFACMSPGTCPTCARGAHQLLRHRCHAGTAKPAAPWW